MNQYRFKSVVVCLTLLASMPTLAHRAHADGVIRDGLGAISIGRGGTNIGHSDNVAIVLENPAGMVNIASEKMGGIGVELLRTDIDYSDPMNNTSAEVQVYPVGQVGYVKRDPMGLWAVGFGVFAPAGFGAEWNVNHAVFGPQRQKSFGALIKILPGFSVRMTEKLSVGAGLGVAVSRTELSGPFHLQSGPPPLPGAPTLLDMEATGAALAWNVGLQYQLSDKTTLGLSYVGETDVEHSGDATATVPIPGFGLQTGDFDADVNLAWPRSLGIGLVHSPCCHHRFSVDAIWYDWSSAFDDVELTLSNPSNPIFLGVLGNSFTDLFPLRWRDSVSVRTGYEHFFGNDKVLRTGYVYHRNPIPDATLTNYIPAILEHAFSVGYGQKVCGWNVDLAYQFSWGASRSVGTSAILGGDFDNSSVDAEAHWFAINVQHRH